MVSLEELKSYEHLFLVDTNLTNCENNNFFWDSYGDRKRDYLETGSLEIELKGYEDFIKLIRRHSVVTIPEITQEIQRYSEILGERISFYNSVERHLPRKGRYLSARKKPSIKKHSQNVRKLIQDLQEASFIAYKESKKRELKTDQRYDSLVGIVKLLSQNIQLKQDTHYIHGEHTREYNDTDERITAVAYWLSLNRKKPLVLTRDGDLVRLFGVTPRLMGADNFLPYNKLFRESLKDFPFRVYLKREGVTKKAIGGSTPNFDKEFIINNLHNGKSEEIREEMLNLWQQFSEQQLN